MRYKKGYRKLEKAERKISNSSNSNAVAKNGYIMPLATSAREQQNRITLKMYWHAIELAVCKLFALNVQPSNGEYVEKKALLMG